MRIPIIQPPHNFQKTNLPCVPGGTVSHDVYACAGCGAIGTVKPGTNTLTLMHGSRRNPNIYTCAAGADSPAVAWHVKISTHRLHIQGKARAHLKPGTVHAVHSPTQHTPEALQSLWVAGPTGLIPLDPTDYQAVRVRVRTRALTRKSTKILV